MPVEAPSWPPSIKDDECTSRGVRGSEEAAEGLLVVVMMSGAVIVLRPPADSNDDAAAADLDVSTGTAAIIAWLPEDAWCWGGRRVAEEEEGCWGLAAVVDDARANDPFCAGGTKPSALEAAVGPDEAEGATTTFVVIVWDGWVATAGC